MIEIRQFSAKDEEFVDIVRIYNMVSHDDSTHIDVEKDSWSLLDKSRSWGRLLLYDNDCAIGFLRYLQGKESNIKKCFFNIFIDPDHVGKGYRQMLYDKMLSDIDMLKCNGLYMGIYDHPNYNHSKEFLKKNGFINKFKTREYSLDLDSLDLSKYNDLLDKLDKQGIQFYDSKLELSNSPNHYKKLEELMWIIDQDIPMPEGLLPERDKFEEFLKHQKMFEDKYYGVEIVAVCNDQYIGATDIEVSPKSDPYKGWTGGLGVIKEYRRQGIATALKVKAYQKLKAKGIKNIRTDNEENNPMYLINVELGFKPEPYGLEFQKEI